MKNIIIENGLLLSDMVVVYQGKSLCFLKVIDSLKIGNLEVNDFTIEIGAMDYGLELDGIVGLDFLKEVGAIIDLHCMLSS